MHHGTPSEVKSAHSTDPAPLSPYPVCQRIIDEGGPQQPKYKKGLKLHALREGPRNQCWGNDREHPLEDHIGEMGNSVGVGARLTAHGRQTDIVQTTQKTTDIRAKRN